MLDNCSKLLVLTFETSGVTFRSASYQRSVQFLQSHHSYCSTFYHDSLKPSCYRIGSDIFTKIPLAFLISRRTSALRFARALFHQGVPLVSLLGVSEQLTSKTSVIAPLKYSTSCFSSRWRVAQRVLN